MIPFYVVSICDMHIMPDMRLSGIDGLEPNHSKMIICKLKQYIKDGNMHPKFTEISKIQSKEDIYGSFRFHQRQA